MSLFPELSIPQVWRRLHPAQETPEPVESAFVQARARIGVTPLRRLFQEVAHPIAMPDTPGAFHRGMRLMAFDGTVLDMPDTPANLAIFGRPQSGRSEGGFPQVRLLVLCELGTHVVCGLNLRPLKYGEQCMVRGLLPRLPAASVMLAGKTVRRRAVAQRSHPQFPAAPGGTRRLSARDDLPITALRLGRNQRFPATAEFYEPPYRERSRGRNPRTHYVPLTRRNFLILPRLRIKMPPISFTCSTSVWT